MPHNPFSSCGVDGDPPSMTVCTQNYVKGAETPSRIPAAILQAVALPIPSCCVARAGDKPASMSF